MNPVLLGIHHVTAIAGDPQRNVDFYTGVLGLRLVKQTVNFDDPATYHLYYGDELGRPGTILTFFPWAGAPQGAPGTGQATAPSFAIPERAIPYWVDRLETHRTDAAEPAERMGERVIAFSDPDGLRLELVGAREADEVPGWNGGPVPGEHAIRGMHAVALSVADVQRTRAFLTEVLGFAPVATEGNRSRFRTTGNGLGSRVDVIAPPERVRGRMGVGTIHHVAWRARDDQVQLEWRARLIEHGAHPTPVLDRQYFRSIYFREPGGVLFEIATDPPGFGVDEAVEELGMRLRLPPWLEPMRTRIEGSLSPLAVPAFGRRP